MKLVQPTGWDYKQPLLAEPKDMIGHRCQDKTNW